MTDYIIAVDLGQAQDYSACVVLHRRWWRKGERPAIERARLWHEIPTILRWELGTPYPRIVEELTELYTLFEQGYSEMGVKMVVDAGGPGRPVIDMLRVNKVRPIGVTITSGDLVHERDDGTLTVPKRDICSALVVAYQNGDVKTNPALDHVNELEEEISKFGYVVKPKSRTVGYEGLEGDVHDDLVVAAALGLWYSTQKLPRGFIDGKNGGSDVRDMDYDPLATA